MVVKPSIVKQFFGMNSASYEKIVSLTTFGSDSRWKKAMMSKMPPCSSVLDLACGTGLLTYMISKKFPDAKITGIDITEGYLSVAKSKLRPGKRITFLLEDAETLNLGEKFDCITSSYIPKYCSAEVLVERCVSHLHPGGTIILHDFTYPENKVIRLFWNLHFLVLQLLGLFVPDWKLVFKKLPLLLRSVNWVSDYREAMKKKGLEVEVEYLTLGCSAILTGSKKV